jgi:hypothetical protein
MRALLPLLALLGCLITLAASAEEPPPTTSQWMSVLLAGRKIGELEYQRRVTGDRVITEQRLQISLNRAGTMTVLGYQLRSEETLHGQPLAFSSRLQMSAQASTVEGSRRPDGRFAVRSSIGGQIRGSVLDWPTGALLAEGQRRAMQAGSALPAGRYTLTQFNVPNLQTAAVDIQVLGRETVELPGGSQSLWHHRQRLLAAGDDQQVDLWLDEQGIARKGRSQLFGQPLEMLDCERTCAQAPVQDIDLLRNALMRSPRVLTAALRQSPMRYRIRLDHAQTPPFIGTDEQHVQRLPDGDWQLDVGPAHAGGQAPPDAEDRLPSEWLQSDAPLIQQLAVQAVGDASDARQKMRRLRAFVSDYIDQHGLDVGYASALEVAGNRRGDCTEYAVLLAALARAQGVPARVVTGMVYAERYAGMSSVFLPHSWMQAWIEDRWVSYDAALQRSDSTHIALASGNGDPWYFFRSAELFRGMRIDSALASWEWLGTPVASAPIAAKGDLRPALAVDTF